MDHNISTAPFPFFADCAASSDTEGTVLISLMYRNRFKKHIRVSADTSRHQLSSVGQQHLNLVSTDDYRIVYIPGKLITLVD